eukprot:m.636530 g.636530  ORF g.636530 m.636530 type:complete len:1256 (-) comp58311_c0_seq2:71-3838(-)
MVDLVAQQGLRSYCVPCGATEVYVQVRIKPLSDSELEDESSWSDSSANLFAGPLMNAKDLSWFLKLKAVQKHQTINIWGSVALPTLATPASTSSAFVMQVVRVSFSPACVLRNFTQRDVFSSVASVTTLNQHKQRLSPQSKIACIQYFALDLAEWQHLALSLEEETHDSFIPDSSRSPWSQPVAISPLMTTNSTEAARDFAVPSVQLAESLVPQVIEVKFLLISDIPHLVVLGVCASQRTIVVDVCPFLTIKNRTSRFLALREALSNAQGSIHAAKSSLEFASYSQDRLHSFRVQEVLPEALVLNIGVVTDDAPSSLEAVVWSKDVTLPVSSAGRLRLGKDGCREQLLIPTRDQREIYLFVLSSDCPSLHSGFSLAISPLILIENGLPSLRLHAQVNTVTLNKILVDALEIDACVSGDPVAPLQVNLRLLADDYDGPLAGADSERSPNSARAWTPQIDLLTTHVQYPFALDVNSYETFPTMISTHIDADGVIHHVLAVDSAPKFHITNQCQERICFVGETASDAMPVAIRPLRAVHFAPPRPNLQKDALEQFAATDALFIATTLVTGQEVSASSLLTFHKIPVHLLGTRRISISSSDFLWIRITMSSCTKLIVLSDFEPSPLGHRQAAQVHAGLQFSAHIWFQSICVLLEDERRLVMDRAAPTSGAAPTSTAAVMSIIMTDILADVSRARQTDPRYDSQFIDQYKLSIDTFQLDNQIQDEHFDFDVLAFPEVMKPLKRKARARHLNSLWLVQKPSPCLEFEAVRDISPVFSRSFRLLSVMIHPIVLRAEDKFAFAMQDVVTNYVASAAVAQCPVEMDTVCVASPSVNWSVLAFGELPVSGGSLSDVPRSEDLHRLSPDILAVVCEPPTYVHRLRLSKLDFLASLHSSIKVFVGLDDAAIHLKAVEMSDIFAAPSSRLREVLLSRYASEGLVQAGWLLGSLGLVGNPSGFFRAVRDGLKDLVVIPFEGLRQQNEHGFLQSCKLGAFSFLRHVSAGTIVSINNFATSVSRNMDQLSMDASHTQFQERLRAAPGAPPATLTNGLAGFGFSILSAVAGIVDQPLRTLTGDSAPSPSTLLGSIGKGMLGTVTKPVSGAMALVSQTSVALLQSAGLHQTPSRYQPEKLSSEPRSSLLRYQWKLLGRPNVTTWHADVLWMQGPSATQLPVFLLLTHIQLYVIDPSADSVCLMLAVRDIVAQEPDRQMLVLLYRPPVDSTKKLARSPSPTKAPADVIAYRFFFHQLERKAYFQKVLALLLSVS